jgi:hypothetical protein
MKAIALVVIAAALTAAGCSSSSSSPSDAGDAQLGYGTGPSDAAEGGEAGEGGDAAPMCNIPAAADTFQPNDAGGIGCQSGVGVVCASPTQYRLACMASDPTLVPPPAPSLMCNLTNNISPTMLNYCCPCK